MAMDGSEVSAASRTTDQKTSGSHAELDADLASLSGRDRSQDRVSFSDKEAQVLELYDQLKELELKKALVQAEANLANDPLPSVTADAFEGRYKQAQKDLLDARALYTLRESVVDSVIQADPILKAVHGGQNATHTERMLHPLVDKRDLLSMAQVNLEADLQATLNSVTMVQADNLKAIRRNKELAATLWELASQLKTHDLESIDDIELRNELEKSRSEAKDARKRCQIVRGLASGFVGGSGVDWSVDETLKDMVLDDED